MVSPNNNLIKERNGAVIGRVRRETLFSLFSLGLGVLGVVQNSLAWLASRGRRRSLSATVHRARELLRLWRV